METFKFRSERKWVSFVLIKLSEQRNVAAGKTIDKIGQQLEGCSSKVPASPTGPG